MRLTIQPFLTLDGVMQGPALFASHWPKVTDPADTR